MENYKDNVFTKTARIPYLDTMKGLLILAVVLHHINWETLSVFNIENTFFYEMREKQRCIEVFFMPAFFIVTGICSNFNKSFKNIFIDNFKSLIIPGLIFDLLLNLNYSSFVLIDYIKRICLYGSSFWFLTCLFEAKIIYWILNKYTNIYLKSIILLSLSIIGFIIETKDFLHYNYYYIRQFCDMTLYLGVGQLIKNKSIDNTTFKISSIIYILGIIIFSIIGQQVPFVTGGYKMYEWWHLPIHWIMSISGSLLLMFLSKKIGNNKYLEYLGKNTLVIYMTHFTLLEIQLSYIGSYIAHANLVYSIIIYLIMFIITTLICLCISYICQLRYTKFLLGKF